MVKKDSLLDRGNSFYSGETVYFVTKHGKEGIVAPLFSELGISCCRIDVDTDCFGTFSGEVERTGSVRETLRRKIEAGATALPECRLFLASEGSFGPDPYVGFLRTDLESLLLWDRKLNSEIYAEYLCRSPMHDEVMICADSEIRSFLEKISFPEHAIIVRPSDSYALVFKGLLTEGEVRSAVEKCAAASPRGEVLIATDLRANFNKTRRAAIAKAAESLIQKLCSLCPACTVPGFWISRGIPGLPCEWCGEPSSAPIAVLFSCVICDYTEERPRPDGRTTLQAAECGYCNP